MKLLPPDITARTAREALPVTIVLLAMFAWCCDSSAAFLINCAGCHTVPQNGMSLLNFQTTTNLGDGPRKVFKVSPGQTAVIQFNVTNGYGGNYALNINNLGAGGINNSNNHLICTPDPTWTSYFPGTSTNFFMAGCATTCPNVWTFNLAIKTNTPADFYALNTQMAGSYSSTMWSQQESIYVQVVAATPPVPTLQAPQQSGVSFSVQVPTTAGFTYYLEYKTNLTASPWNAVAQTSGDGTSKTLTDSTATNSQRFYHARVQ